MVIREDRDSGGRMSSFMQRFPSTTPYLASPGLGTSRIYQPRSRAPAPWRER
jgi:hypothetical protein